jgi:hypothetical protein
LSAQAAAIPFNAAAHAHVEGPWADVSFTPGAATTNLLVGSQGEVPAYPFLKGIWLRVEATGGTGGTLTADGPWNVFQSIQLADANGTAIVGGIGTFNGWDLYLANKYGGQGLGASMSDPAGHPDFVGTSPNFNFFIRIPIEFDPRTGSGALGNMNANAPFRLTLIGNATGNGGATQSPATGLYQTNPTTIPSVRVRCYLECWTLPAAQNLAGIPQEQIPPGGLGTTQYWRKQPFSITASGSNTTKFTDVGNLIRGWILSARDTNGNRLTDAVWPDPYNLNWDGVPLLVEPSRHRRHDMACNLSYSRYNTSITVGTIEAGVLAFMFNHPNGTYWGGDGPNAWLPTLQSTRIEFAGSWGASVTQMEVITNSIAAVETAQPFSYASSSGQLSGPAQPSTRR